MTIEEVIEMRKTNGIRINYEYQRAPRWNRPQQQHLIDSVLRGYHLPLFYFHLKTETWGTKPRNHYEVIDGQQRINAFVQYTDGEFALPDPKNPRSRFPKFIQEQSEPCPWADAKYNDLDGYYRQKLMRQFLFVVEITSDDELEIRDLFLRLQAGTPLTPQERRDAFPGAFTQFIVDLGGRTEVDINGRIAVKGGHWLFRDVVKMNTPTRAVAARQLAATLSMQLLSSVHMNRLRQTNNTAIDDFYYQQLDFDPDGNDAKLITDTFDDIHRYLADYNGPPIKQHELICLVVLWARLHDQYADGWQTEIAGALSDFKREAELARRAFSEGDVCEMYLDYVSQTSSRGSDSAQKNESRARYFENWMLTRLNPTRKDAVRAFSNDLRERLFNEQGGLCAYASDRLVCGDSNPMAFHETEVHHVDPHSKGGKTEIENAVLTHRECNRKIGNRFIPPPDWTSDWCVLDTHLLIRLCFCGVDIRVSHFRSQPMRERLQITSSMTEPNPNISASE